MPTLEEVIGGRVRRVQAKTGLGGGGAYIGPVSAGQHVPGVGQYPAAATPQPAIANYIPGVPNPANPAQEEILLSRIGLFNPPTNPPAPTGSDARPAPKMKVGSAHLVQSPRDRRLG